MSPLFTVLRVLVRGRHAPRVELPAPGPAPHALPPKETVAILVIDTVSVLWLLAHGYTAGAALAIIAGIGVMTTEIAARLARARLADR